MSTGPVPPPTRHVWVHTYGSGWLSGAPQAERLTGEWRLMGGAITRRQVRPSTTTGWLPIRDVRCGPAVSGHRGHGRPGEVVVQHPSEPVVDGEAGVDQCSLEAGDPSTVHLLVRTVGPYASAQQGSSLNTSFGHRATPPSRRRAAGYSGWNPWLNAWLTTSSAITLAYHALGDGAADRRHHPRPRIPSACS